MKVISILFIFISTMGLSQFSPIWTVNSNFNQFDIRAFEMNDAGQMLLITDPYNGGPTSDLMVYSSTDFGVNWDSTYLFNFYLMKDNAVVTEGGKMYFTSIQNVYPTGGSSPYQRKVFHSSLNEGVSWSEKTIDSIVVGSNFSRSIAFLNDSTGMYFYQSGKFLTINYGETWQKISGIGAENLGVLDDQFIFYWYQSAMTVNPFTSQVDSFSYLPYCEGNVNVSFYKNGVSYRMIYGSDGEDWGSEYNHNYASFNIDELPLGNQRFIHFPQRAALVDIDATQSCIHLVLNGRYVRSCDGGNTFYDVDAFNGNMNEQVMYIEFINDTLGYLVSKNLITYEWRLWKTTNGGGANLAPILTNQFYAGVEELESNLEFTLYPNPTSAGITIEAKDEILKIELYSMEGKLILSEESNSKSVNLDLASTSQGYYVVKVFTSSNIGYSKILKQ